MAADRSRWSPIPLGLSHAPSSMQVGAIAGLFGLLLLLLLLGCLVALCSLRVLAGAAERRHGGACYGAAASGPSERAMGARHGAHEVHISLHPPAGESSEAQQALASALRKALDEPAGA